MKQSKLLYYDILGFHVTAMELLTSNFQVITLATPRDDTNDILKEMDVVMAPLGFEFGRDKMGRCSKLKVIGSSTLSVPHIDIECAESKGINVCYLGNEKEFLEDITPTAELTWGLILAITRRIHKAHKFVCSGRWGANSLGYISPCMLSNMSLGIVGLGRLGSMVASYGKAFGMDVYYYSPRSSNSEYKRTSTLIELAKSSDIVSIHAHHTHETEAMVNMDFFKAMKPGSFIINTSRGAIIDEKSLLEALESEHLAGAALDVMADEYKPGFKTALKDSPLVGYAKNHENLILTPHYGGATVDAWEKTQKKTIELIINALSV